MHQQRHSIPIASGATSAPLFLPDRQHAISVGLVPAAGASGKVQYTLSPTAAVDAGTATWRDWALGVVSTVTDDILQGPVTALRGVSASGSVTLEVVG